MLEPVAQEPGDDRLDRLVDGVEEGGQGLPGAGRGGEQGVAAFADGGPGALLGRKGLTQSLGEPRPDDRVEGEPGHLLDYDPVTLAAAVGADSSRSRSHDMDASEVEALLRPSDDIPLRLQRGHRFL